MVPMLDDDLWFPDPTQVHRQEVGGLVATGGDLSVPRLVLAYQSGIFPWSVNPITWWSPDPRGVLELEAFRIPRSLRRTLHRSPFEITVDQAFRRVIESCARARRAGKWITPEFIDAYTRLHRQGSAHSIECWQQHRLVGGIYGVAIGGLFAGESMFYSVSNASKIALCSLVQRLRERHFALFDIQMVTPLTAQFGASTLPRKTYLERLREALKLPCQFHPISTNSDPS